MVPTELGVSRSDLLLLGQHLVGEELLRRAFEDSAVAGFIADAGGAIVRVNRALCALLDHTEDALVGANVTSIIPSARGASWRRWGAGAGAHGVTRMETRCLRRDGTLLAVEVTVSAAGVIEDAPAYVIAQVHELSRRDVAERRLAHQAMHDPVTDLPNRTLFLDRLERGLRRHQHTGALLAVLFMDLDRFKQINDSLGHAAGDQVLLETARRLREALRPGDTVARFGGDEFAVLCEDLDGEDTALEIAARMLRVVSEPMDVGDHQTTVNASIGIALARADSDGESLLGDADFAMYRAKEKGRNRCELYDATLRADALIRMEQTNALRRALEESELRIVYQPLLRIDGSAVVGVEALVRWEHPTLGLLGPERFIGLAEESGQMVQLGVWVMREACREVAGWAPPPGGEPLLLSVNLSAQQLNGSTALLDSLRTILGETGLDPGRLCLEITESVLLDDVDAAVEALARLRDLGVRVAIDDFGTGYSSLSYLRRFPVDAVKIDRSFVTGLGHDPAADAIVAAVVNVSRALGLTVVAEGVETDEQLVALRALGCDWAQGYLWSEPLSPAVAHRWIRARRPDVVAARPLELGALLAQRVDALRRRTDRRVLLEVPANLPACFADAVAVRIVADHLLANAAAYSAPDRPVVVTAAADRRAVRITVSDFGIGMSGDEVARCFEQFWQARTPESPRTGVGIGLYIVRSLVEAMGGHVSVRSAVGRGSTFTVVLPRSARAAARVHSRQGGALDVGEPSSVQEFMRQIGVPMRTNR